MDHRTAPGGAKSGPKLTTHKIRLEIVDGPSQGLCAELAGPEARIGSGAECDVVLRDPTVSRRHVVVRIERELIRVIDAGSRNGTFLDGIQIRDAYARPDSTLAIGDSKLRLRMLREMVEVPLSSRTNMGGLLGQSVAMRRVFGVLERVAPTAATVLVEGETGTGKELVAEALHDESERAQGRFHVLDCSAISPSLIESALFGHVRGAFTGALTDRIGAFEEADGGTLFLDEIGELPLDMQPKLLRALESRKIYRVGSNVPRKVDVRIVAATNRPLAREVELGRFREDLYHRLNVIQIALPPLRERLEDIPLLVRHFEEGLRSSSPTRGPLSEEDIQALLERSWPGNVRELRNTVIRLHSLGVRPAREGSDGQAASGKGVSSVPEEIDFSEDFLATRERLVEAFERRYLTEALRRSGGNVSQAAQMLRVSRKFVHRAIAQYKLRGERTPEEDEAAML